MKIGILLDNLGPSQAAYTAIIELNKWLSLSVEHDGILFYKNLTTPCVKPNCAVMAINEISALGQNSILLATDLDGAGFVGRATTPATKALYLWDLEWLRGNNNFLQNMHILRAPNINLIGRSPAHARAIHNYCNKKVVSIIEGFSLREIVNRLTE